MVDVSQDILNAWVDSAYPELTEEDEALIAEFEELEADRFASQPELEV
jgi:hypothetical protein